VENCCSVQEEKKLREDGTYDIYGRGGESNKISEGGSDIGGAGHAYRGQEVSEHIERREIQLSKLKLTGTTTT